MTHRSATPTALICTYGTRGDVEPFLALATGLRRAGFDVLFATSVRYREWVEENGIPFFAMSDESLAQIESPDGRTMLEGAAGLFKRVAAGIRLARKSGPINEELIQQTWQAALQARPDVIVCHAKLFAAPHIAGKLDIPCFMGALQPMFVPTRQAPVMGLPSLPLPGYNRLTYRLVLRSYAMFRKAINRFRTQTLGLDPIRKSAEVLYPQTAKPIQVLHAISPHVFPRPSDWPETAHVVGYWDLKKSERYAPPDELAAFLARGAPPVFVGFGSMTSVDPRSLGKTVVEALRQSRQRGIVAKGWADLDVAAEEDIIAIPNVPYDWLFPQMKAVVHHGGAGTTAEGFRAGIPSVICPFFGDQPGWARLSVKLGVGATPVPRRKLTAERLARSIRQAVGDPTLRTRSAELGRAIRNEDGVANSVDLIIRSLDGDERPDRSTMIADRLR